MKKNFPLTDTSWSAWKINKNVYLYFNIFTFRLIVGFQSNVGGA